MKDLAAKYGYYNHETLPEHIKEDKYFKEHPEWATEDFYRRSIPEGLKALKTVQVGVFVKVREQKRHDGSHELYYVDFVETVVFSDKVDFPMRLAFSKGKYYLYPIYDVIIKVQGETTYRQQKPFVDALSKPNLIGVFSDKKVSDWVEYCTTYVEALRKAANALQEKNQANLATIEDFIKRAQCKSVQRQGKYTTVKTNFFTVDFEMEDGGEYLRTKIRFEGNIENIIKNKL